MFHGLLRWIVFLFNLFIVGPNTLSWFHFISLVSPDLYGNYIIAKSYLMASVFISIKFYSFLFPTYSSSRHVTFTCVLNPFYRWGQWQLQSNCSIAVNRIQECLTLRSYPPVILSVLSLCSLGRIYTLSWTLKFFFPLRRFRQWWRFSNGRRRW